MFIERRGRIGTLTDNTLSAVFVAHLPSGRLRTDLADKDASMNRGVINGACKYSVAGVFL